MTTIMNKPMFSDVNKGSFKDMWKDSVRMEKWLLQPNENIKYISISGDQNEEYFIISTMKYNKIQNGAQMIFCSTIDWPSYCISYLTLESQGEAENDIIETLKKNFSQ